MAKILVSPDYGAGWSTWCHGDKAQEEYMLRYQPLIDALEAGEDIGYDEDNRFGSKPYKPGSILERFERDYIDKFGEESSPYLGGARDLKVVEVHGPFRITEYDGSEGVESYDPGHYFDPTTWDEVIDVECEEEPLELEAGEPEDIEI
jgi:hypothetical protein